jgi:hydrogenase nickel incorporation protein HypA/HybF
MHELSIAMNVVEIAEEEAKKNNASVVSKIEIDVGKLSGVIVEALTFAMDSAKQNTCLSDAEVVINELVAKAKCEACGHEFETKDYFSICPECGNFKTDIIAGKELQVRSMQLE